MIIILYKVKDKKKKSQFFKKIFLLAYFSINIVFEILFLILGNKRVYFIELELFWKTYTNIKAILATKQVKLIEKKQFMAANLKLKEKTYVIYLTRFADSDKHINFS